MYSYQKRWAVATRAAIFELGLLLTVAGCTDDPPSQKVPNAATLPSTAPSASSPDASPGAPAGNEAGQASPTSCEPRTGDPDELLIDDFAGPERRLPELAGRAGEWFFYDDGSGGEQVLHPAGSAESALHVSSTGFSEWGSGLGVALSPDTTRAQACAYDASMYGGIQFRARGEGRLRLRLSMPSNLPVAEGGVCTKPGEECYDWPGHWLTLSAEWATYSLPFCSLLPEYWTSDPEELDSSALVALHFMLQGNVDFWLDDVTFITRRPETEAGACQTACPFDAAGASALAPDEVAWISLSDELTIDTFEQQTTRCGPVTRRYLSYVPKSLPSASDAPVLIALHGSGANAESFQATQTRGRLDALANRDGFVVVYGNAAPGAYSVPDVPNSGAWRQAYFDDGEVDDVDYLLQVLSRLEARGITSGNNPVFLIGVSNGGGMVLQAARMFPQRFTGIAPFMAFDDHVPAPVPSLAQTTLKRVFFGYSFADPGLPAGYESVLSDLPFAWARALGMSEAAINERSQVQLSDVVSEGKSYAGTAPAALATRDSRATQVEIVDPGVEARVRVLAFDRAGHFWPNPTADTEDWVLSRWGFRNQDVDASDLVWDFFRESLGT